MLSIQENEKLARVGPGSPMGEYIRRFWIPFRLSDDVPEADGEPLRVRLMGEELLAFRATDGQVALVQRNCPHRWADLFYGRNEENGIRCAYHGWKFDANGSCVDMPTETDESTYKDKIRIVAYPVRESAGILWTYMGPKELRPEMPDFEYLRMPETHRFVSWNWQQTNYAQAIEGGIDSAHSNYLHATLDAYHMTDAWRAQWERSQNLRDKYHARDQHPKFFAEDTDYGVITGARRDTGEGQFYWRYNLFLLPFYTMPPSAPTQKFFHAFVPIDDNHNMRWTFVWNLRNALPSASIEEWRNGSGLHAASLPGYFRIGSSDESTPLFAEHFPLRNKENDYLVSRDYQKRLTFTGITGTGEQDLSVQEGMGHITPRNKEHLGTTDIGIIKSRRRLLKEAAALQDGEEPYAASRGNVYYVRSGDTLLDPEENWVSGEKIRALQTAAW